jgi:CheY-like chemotaxis protein
MHDSLIGDEQKLRQMLANIVSNAVKFTPDGGEITLTIRELEFDSDSAVFRFVCKDSGVGMDKEFIKRIFEPFARASDLRTSKIEGTGLGMTIAKSVAMLMDGDITVESVEGEGSVFTAQVKIDIDYEKSKLGQELDGIRVLVVDSDKESANYMVKLLNSIGADASSVYSGNGAIELIQVADSSNGAYDAVLMPLMLEDMDAITCTEEIRGVVGDKLPIIVASDEDTIDIEKEGHAKGVTLFTSRPLFRRRFIYIIKKLTGGEACDDFSGIAVKQEKVSFKGKKILLAEDNNLNMIIATELLKSMDITVEGVNDGREALERLLSTDVGTYDMVIMDIQMPNMDGYQATEAIRNSGRDDLKDIPIVAMTADAFKEDIQHCVDIGMSEHITKPVELKRLIAVLKEFLI